MSELEILQEILACNLRMTEALERLAGQKAQQDVDAEIAAVRASGVDPVQYLKDRYRKANPKKKAIRSSRKRKSSGEKHAV